MIVPLEGINPLWEGDLLGTAAVKSKPETGEMALPFADIFQYAIDNVKVKEAEKNEVEYMLATGQLDNPASMSIASSQYQMSVDLLVQLRNKALDAYSELTRISL